MTRGTTESLNLGYSGKDRAWKDAVAIVFLAIVLGTFAFELVRGADAIRSQPDEVAASEVLATTKA